MVRWQVSCLEQMQQRPVVMRRPAVAVKAGLAAFLAEAVTARPLRSVALMALNKFMIACVAKAWWLPLASHHAASCSSEHVDLLCIHGQT